MAAPIVRTFVIDTSQAEQSLKSLNVVSAATQATIDALYAELIKLDTALSGVAPDSAKFTELSASIAQVEASINTIETGKLQDVATDLQGIGAAANNIDTANIEKLEGAIDDVAPAASASAKAIDDIAGSMQEVAPAAAQTATAFDDISDSVKQVDGSKLGELEETQKQVEGSSKSLKLQLRELQAQLANTEPDSAKYRELSQEAGILKDKIQDAAQAVGTQAGGAFERVGGSLGLVTSRIASLDFEGAGEAAKQLAKNIGDIKPGDITKGIKGIGSALGSVGKALLTNPLFLIGAAIALAVVYSKELLSLVDGLSSADAELLDSQKQRAELSKQQISDIGEQENLLRLQGKSEREILQLKIAAAQQAIIDQRAVIETTKIQKKAQIDAAQRNADITSGILQFLTLPLQLILAQVDLVTKTAKDLGLISEETFNKVGNLRDKFNTSVTGLLFDPAKVAADGDASIKEAEKALKQLENTQAGFELSIKSIDDKAATDRKTAAEKNAADAKTAAEKTAADQLKAEKEVSDLLNQLYEENVKDFEDAEKKKTAAAEAEADKRKKAEEEYNAAITALRIEQDAANLTQDQKDIIAIDNKYLDLREKAIAAGQSTVEIDAAYKAALEAQEVASENKKLVTKQQSVSKGLEFAQSAIAVLQAFSDASTKNGERDAKKKFKTDKALAIGAATVQTAAAVTGALTAGGNPIKLATGAQFVEAGVAAALGLAQIIKIKNSQFGGGSTGGNDTNSTIPSTGGGGDTGSQPAQFNPLASSFLQDRPEQLTPRAYVLAGDVASQQEVREKVQDLARIG
jgi:hypothetical protein